MFVQVCVLCFFFVFICQGAGYTKKLPTYLTHRRVMHACGALEGVKYTNSEEALMATLERGADSVEIDMCFTKDGVLACNHNWKEFGGEAPTWRTFIRKRTIGGFTPMSAKRALSLLSETDTWMFLDTQEKETAAVYKEVVKILRDLGKEEYLDKVVAQIYHKREYKKIKEVYPFKTWCFQLYKLRPLHLKRETYESIAQFCEEKDIGMVSLSKSRPTREVCALFHDHGLLVGVHPVNKEEKEDYYSSIGADFIMTDMLYYN